MCRRFKSAPAQSGTGFFVGELDEHAHRNSKLLSQPFECCGHTGNLKVSVLVAPTGLAQLQVIEENKLYAMPPYVRPHCRTDVTNHGHVFHEKKTAAAELPFCLVNRIGIRTVDGTFADRGDDEGHKEWDHGREPGHRDPTGDYDVDVLITQGGTITVAYRSTG